MSDWIEWQGGECPVEPGTKIDVQLRDGLAATICGPEFMLWVHRQAGTDIIAYRIVSDAPKPELDTSNYVEPKILSVEETRQKFRAFEAAQRDPVTSPALKDDNDKLRYDLIPPEALAALSAVLTYGANKYGDRNWEKGFRWGRLFGACMRHLWAWWGGENKDPETGMSHLWHALACVAFMVAHEERRIGVDDRKVKE